MYNYSKVAFAHAVYLFCIYDGLHARSFYTEFRALHAQPETIEAIENNNPMMNCYRFEN